VLHIVSGEKRQEETLYRDARAVRRTVRDGAGELRYRERYSYYASGKLQEVARTYPDGRVVRSRYEFVGERLTAEWHETGEETRLVRYDDQGRTIAETHWVGDEVTQEVRYEYAGPRDRLPDRSVTEDPSAGIEVVRRFDEQGRVVEIRRRRNGESPDVVSVVTRSYGEHGLTREQTERPGGSRSTEYEYTSDGELALRREYVDGTIAERVEFREENRRVRELYRHGELVLRVFLRGEERLREEIIRDGEVVEERRFGGNGAGGES
jgi:YD repeat-containing protein